MKVAQLLAEANKMLKAFKEPALPPAKDEDIQAVREAVGFLFAVQKRLEKMDSIYKDDDGYGGIGIYGHHISFRWFGGGGEAIPTAERQAIRKIVKEERAKRKQLKRFLSDRVQMEPGEGDICVPWLSGYWSPEWQSAWKAAGMKHVDYEDMVKDMHSLGEAVKLHEIVDDIPLVWVLAKKELDKGKKVGFDAWITMPRAGGLRRFQGEVNSISLSHGFALIWEDGTTYTHKISQHDEDLIFVKQVGNNFYTVVNDEAE